VAAKAAGDSAGSGKAGKGNPRVAGAGVLPRHATVPLGREGFAVRPAGMSPPPATGPSSGAGPAGGSPVALGGSAGAASAAADWMPAPQTLQATIASLQAQLESERRLHIERRDVSRREEGGNGVVRNLTDAATPNHPAYARRTLPSCCQAMLRDKADVREAWERKAAADAVTITQLEKAVATTQQKLTALTKGAFVGGGGDDGAGVDEQACKHPHTHSSEHAQIT